MTPTTHRTETRLLTAVSYRPSTRSLSVVYDDGEIAQVAVDALKLPLDAKIENVQLDEFQRGIEFLLADGTMHDVAADYITWLTDESYRRQYPDEDIGPRIGSNVAALRKQRGMSQGELARTAGILGPNLSRLESGKHVPTLDVLLRVAQALNVTLSKIVSASVEARPTASSAEAMRVEPRVVTQGTPRPDAMATREIHAAMVQSEHLLRLVDFPLTVESPVRPEPRVQDNWDVVAPAMLFSASSCLLSLRLLAETPAPRREQDAIVLLRRLYEHIVDFAWIAIDPAVHVKKWVADDRYYRLKIDDDFARLGQAQLKPTKRTEFDQYLKAHGRMPDVASRADAADKHWSKLIQGHGVFPSKAPPAGGSIVSAQGGNWSLRTQYMIIYRLASGAAHPSPSSLAAYIDAHGASGRFSIGMNPHDHDDRYAYTFAPLVFATMLFVSEHVLGFPKRADVEKVFEDVRS